MRTKIIDAQVSCYVKLYRNIVTQCVDILKQLRKAVSIRHRHDPVHIKLKKAHSPLLVRLCKYLCVTFQKRKVTVAVRCEPQAGFQLFFCGVVRDIAHSLRESILTEFPEITRKHTAVLFVTQRHIRRASHLPAIINLYDIDSDFRCGVNFFDDKILANTGKSMAVSPGV